MGLAGLLSVVVVHSGRSVIEHAGHRISMFPECVASLGVAVQEAKQPAELLVADFPNTMDLAPLRKWLMRKSAIPFRMIPFRVPFNKGLAANKLATLASGSTLFFLDADMIVPAEVIVRGMAYAAAGRCWFPGYWSRRENEGADPKANGSGTGNAFFPDDLWRRFGPWPVQEHWGGDEKQVSTRVVNAGMSAEALCDRQPVAGFEHIWHPKGLGWGERKT
jgi:hypothetical protein